MKPPKGGTPANDSPAITNAKQTRGIFFPNPATSSILLNPLLFMTPSAMNARAVVMPPMRKKYRLACKPRAVTLVIATKL